MNSSAYERDCISLQLKTAIEEKNHLAVEHKFFIALRIMTGEVIIQLPG
jgi:hypothetical protein